MTCTTVIKERAALESARDHLGPDTQAEFAATLAAWNAAVTAHVAVTGCKEFH